MLAAATLEPDDMIAACETQDFVPFGREYSRHHPGKFQLQVQNTAHADHGLPLLKSFRDISLHDSSKKEQWVFASHEDSSGSSFDEELYVSGNTVVWSRGGQDGVRSVVKTYTVDTPVLQALWCSFVLPHKDVQLDLYPTFDVPGMIQTGVCVVEATNVTFFMDKGGEYVAALPFQVAKMWKMKNGLIFERTLSHAEITMPKKNAPNQTVLFSMLHPLDEVAPIITKTSGGGGSPKVGYMTDNTQHLVFTSTNPSLAFTYDTELGLHSVWRIRSARADEQSTLSVALDNTSFLHLMSGTPGHNQSSSNHSRFFTNISGQSPCVSPLRSFSGRISSPAGLSRMQSPSVTNMAAVSRSQSPGLAGSSSMYRFHSPSPASARSPGAYFRTPSGSHNVSLTGNDSITEFEAPLKPEICFDHLWTEPPPPMRDGPLGKSSKAFLCKDFCGQQYLCFMVPYRQQLRCVKFEESNDLSQLIFGSITVLQAKDVTPIESLDLLLVLEPSGIIVVYTGTTKVSHVHIPMLPVGSWSASMQRAVTPLGSPARGGIFTSSRPPSAMDARFDDEFNYISPVPSETDDMSQLDASISDVATGGNSFIQNLRDNVGNRFTIELLSGQLCRTSMPPLSKSPGIGMCLQALKHLLPRDTALQVLGKWYTSHNTPGSPGNQSEWMLFTKCLLTMMGYDISRLALTSKRDLDTSMSPVMSAKRARPSDQGSEDDWDNLVNSDHHRFVSENLEDALELSPCTAIPDRVAYSKPCSINDNSLLFVHSPAVMLALHLVYEEMKLNVLLAEELQDLATVLFQIASDLKCLAYTDYYCRDFPGLYDASDDISQITEDDLRKMQYPSVFPRQVPSVQQWIYYYLRGQDWTPLPYIPTVCNNIRNVVTLYAILLNKDLLTEQAMEKCLKKIAPAGHRAPTADLSMSQSFQTYPHIDVSERLILTMSEMGILQKDLECLPVGVALPFREAILHCRCNPPSDWPEAAYIMIGRQDLAQLMSAQNQKPRPPQGSLSTPSSPQGKGSKEEEDGMEHMDEELLKLRFSDDLRVQEVRRLLQSARPARIALVQRPEVSDHDFIEEQERHLLAICIRTMSLPTGRGMFTLSTYQPLPTETLPIPKLCLTGRAPPRNTTVDLTHIDTPANMAAWPQFHNGVAAGLRIANVSQVESTWIIYNKPKSNELSNEYAGFLMALGLNNHLVNLNTLNVHDYLSKGHEMTTIGLLLGLAAAKKGTMDMAITRLLSIHVPALLPPTSTELNIPHNIQVAAILGVGLVYQGTGHLHMAETLLSEIGRPPGPEMENCSDRESYALAAGLALGLLMFGKGRQTVGLSDHSMADILCHFMVGGHKRPLPGPYKDRYKSPSYLIWEGDSVNVNVTAPGATLALGMLFFNTGNSAVAEWLKAPDTQFMLDHVRPDFLLLRTLSRGLVMWDSIVPNLSWVGSHIPEIVKKYAFKKNQTVEEEDIFIDFETMSQAYCNIVAGACMALSLKFAGSANQTAYNTLMDCMKRCLQALSVPSYCEQAGKSSVENGLCVILTGLAMVMAGTGNLEVMRICRMLRKRVGPQYSYMMYGSHMSIAMSTGLLFLGGGRYTLSTKPEAIGALLCAFFPIYPAHSNDNRYHLQAFRHLYVLAAEPRLVLPRDVDTGHICYVPLEIKFKDCVSYKNVNYRIMAPCILPELDRIEEIKVLGPRYWPVTFRVDKNWNTIMALLQKNGTLSVKQRAGHLSYMEDPQGYRSMLAKSLTSDHSCHCSNKPNIIKSFTSDPRIIALAEFFLKSKEDMDLSTVQELSTVVYECVTQEKPEATCLHFILEQLIHQCQKGLHTTGVWQLKLVLAYYTSRYRINHTAEDQPQHLLEMEFLLCLKRHLEDTLDKWHIDNVELFLRYLKGEEMKGQEITCLSGFLAWFDIPHPEDIAPVLAKGESSLPVLCKQLPGLSVVTIMRLLASRQSAST
ncbi:anaphase-promoting complex subunit 1-like [Haliotis rufescens]|uniref:anaphase-promoting complex subunit 1-like n=1 Tax=Haliotis rufescens TaxID=6454 RepID=UPI001EB04C72|nr:anaphase-promoting complex subunit 1-like [Haliotis rufescens]